MADSSLSCSLRLRQIWTNIKHHRVEVCKGKKKEQEHNIGLLPNLNPKYCVDLDSAYDLSFWATCWTKILKVKFQITLTNVVSNWPKLWKCYNQTHNAICFPPSLNLFFPVCLQASDPDSGSWGDVKYSIYGSGADLWVWKTQLWLSFIPLLFERSWRSTRAPSNSILMIPMMYLNNIILIKLSHAWSLSDHQSTFSVIMAGWWRKSDDDVEQMKMKTSQMITQHYQQLILSGWGGGVGGLHSS